jgi:hypothetical protein
VHCISKPLKALEAFFTNSCGRPDFRSPCIPNDDSTRVGIDIKNLSPEYDGDYHFDTKGSGYLYANRPVYLKGNDAADGKCIWWHKEYRHWWVGPCENVGNNAGFAYINEDTSCPYPYFNNDFKLTWRRGGSDEIVSGIESYAWAIASAGGKKVEDLTGTAGVNAIIQNRTYKQKCKFTFRNRKIQCL